MARKLRVEVVLGKIGKNDIPSGQKQLDMLCPLPENLDGGAAAYEKAFTTFKNWGKEEEADGKTLRYLSKAPNMREVIIEGLKIHMRKEGQKLITEEVRESGDLPRSRRGRGVSSSFIEA